MIPEQFQKLEKVLKRIATYLGIIALFLFLIWIAITNGIEIYD